MSATRLSSPVVARIAPFAVFILFMILGDAVAWLREQGLLTASFDERWLYPLKTVMVAAVLAYLWSRYDELRRGSRLRLSSAALAAVVGVVVFVLWINLDLPLLRVGTPAGFNPLDAQGQPDLFWIAVRTVGAVVVVPLAEELFWRSFLMRWLDQPQFHSHPPERVSLRAILISSALFATAHDLWFAGLIAGIAYGWLYRQCGTLWAPILAHAITNGLLAYWVVVTRQWSFW